MGKSQPEKPPAGAGPVPAPAAPTRSEASGPPPLNLASLEERLRDTHAIGVFTKLSLKNQVDDLLARFRAFYQGKSDITLAQLRQAYELLLLKVVSLLQDGDAPLAADVSASREGIWQILSDPRKFSQL